jgi:hypothetical protein
MMLIRQPLRSASALWLLPLSFALGCGGTGEVTGKVTFANKPVTSGSVLILASDKLTYTSQLDENGAYKITNVPPGDAKVVVSSPNPAITAAGQGKSPHKDPLNRFKTGPLPKNGPAVAPPTTWFRIPAHYAEFETSGLRLTVLSGDNTFDIPLEAAKKK